jgi:phage-related protein
MAVGMACVRDEKRSPRNPDGTCRETRRHALLLCLYREHLDALHGFIEKTLTTPDEDLALARKRKKELEQ